MERDRGNLRIGSVGNEGHLYLGLSGCTALVYGYAYLMNVVRY